MNFRRRALRLWNTLILSVAFTLASLAQGEKTESVAGKVLSAASGRPLANALVSLVQTKSNQTFATVYTGEDGTFHFNSVPEGKYRLRGQATGYVASLYLQHGDDGLSTAIVTGAGLDTSSLLLNLTPSATISGHIVDDTGEPIVQAHVTLYRQRAGGEQRTIHFRDSFTNDANSFEFLNLPPGRYFLAVAATPWYAVHPPPEEPEAQEMFRSAVDPALDVTYPMTFYPAATLDREASPIDLKSGDDFVADTHLTPVHALSITLPATDPAPDGSRRASGYRLLHMIFGQAEFEPVQMQGSNGVMRITGLAPGQYDLRVNQQGTVSRDLGSVTLTSESVTLPNQSAPVGSSCVVQVRVHTPEDLTLAKNTSVSLYQRNNPRGVNFNQQLGGKDSVDFNEVPTGEYRFTVNVPGRSLHLATVQVNGQDIPTKVLPVTGKDTLKVDLTLGGQSTSVDGFVRRADGKPSVPSMVILVPAGEDTNADLFRRDQTDLDGSFTLGNVLPGNYLLLALDNAWDIRWNDTATLTPYLLQSTPINVKPGGTPSIHLKEPIGLASR